jgi:bifunctional non-homologous end joining protein LigD
MATKDALSAYNAKRDFARTREPKGRVAKAGGNSFVVQKHAATRLHWDFRLEMDGVLKSWAVTRGPSIDPADKRLAVRTEDHPLDYGAFEGSIPKGEYGGGSVMLWDRGSWEPIPGKSADDLKEGHLHFILHGERMKGEWLLVRMKGRPGEKRENWLLRKVADKYAGTGDTLVEQSLTSVLTERSMAQIEADKAGEQSLAGARGKAFSAKMKAAKDHNAQVSGRRKTRAPRPPAFVKPQLATLVDAAPSGNGWLHEIKYDGYRALIAASGDQVTLYTRNGLDWTDKFAPLVGAIAALDLPACLIDGEVVALNAAGNPDFSMPGLLNAIIEGKIDTTFLISHRLGLEQAPEGYRMFHDRQNEVTKIVLKPGLDRTAI